MCIVVYIKYFRLTHLIGVLVEVVGYVGQIRILIAAR